MLTVSEDEEDLLAAMKAGERGYVLKGVSATDLTTIVRSVNNGEVYVAPALAFGLLRDMGKPRESNPLSDLTARERQVLQVRSRVEAALLAAKLGMAAITILDSGIQDTECVGGRILRYQTQSCDPVCVPNPRG